MQVRPFRHRARSLLEATLGAEDGEYVSGGTRKIYFRNEEMFVVGEEGLLIED